MKTHRTHSRLMILIVSVMGVGCAGWTDSSGDRATPNDTPTRVANEMKAPRDAPPAPAARVEDDSLMRIAALEDELARVKAMLPPPPDLTPRVTRLEAELERVRAVPIPAMPDVSRFETQPAHDQDLDKLRRENDELVKRVKDLEAQHPHEKPVAMQPPPAPPKFTAEIRAEELFAPGKAALKPEGISSLKKTAGALIAVGAVVKTVRVDGHTDDRPIRTKEFPSNMELSMARANSVAKFLQQETGLAENRFAIAGHADAQPIASNKDAVGRARNRRVEVTIEQTQ